MTPPVLMYQSVGPRADDPYQDTARRLAATYVRRLVRTA
jgi:hypothetical protein